LAVRTNAISSRLGPDLGNAAWPAPMEADFLTGLNDHDSAALLASIQSLGGLKLSLSRDAVHHVIEKGDDAEMKWAVDAVLRKGDVSVLPRFKHLLADGDGELHEFASRWSCKMLRTHCSGGPDSRPQECPE
jgi:hypothetical protein